MNLKPSSIKLSASSCFLVSVLTLRINQPFSILLPFFDYTIKKIDYTNSWLRSQLTINQRVLFSRKSDIFWLANTSKSGWKLGFIVGVAVDVNVCLKISLRMCDTVVVVVGMGNDRRTKMAVL